MTFAEAAAIMMRGGSSSEIKKPELITYKDINNYTGMLTEYYNHGSDSEYTKKIGIEFSNKGTMNEQISRLVFLNDDGSMEESVSFSGFYVG